MKTIAFLILATVACCGQPTDNLRKLLTDRPELITLWNNSAIDRSNIINFAYGLPSPYNTRTNLGWATGLQGYSCDPVPGVVFMAGAGWPAVPQPGTTNHSQALDIFRTMREAKCTKCGNTNPKLKSYDSAKLDPFLFKCTKCAEIWAAKEAVQQHVAFMAPLQASPPPNPPPPVPFNIELSPPYESEEPGQVYVFAYTTQLANNELAIESSPNDLFSFAQAALWYCYPNEQPVAALFLIPKDVDRFYRAVNTPCTGAAPFAPAGVFVAKPLSTKLQKFHTKRGYTLGKELPSSNPKVRLFILKPPAPPKTMPPMPGQ